MGSFWDEKVEGPAQQCEQAGQPAQPTAEAPIYIGGITLTPTQVEQAFFILQARRKEEAQRKWNDEQIVYIQVTRDAPKDGA